VENIFFSNLLSSPQEATADPSGIGCDVSSKYRQTNIQPQQI